jgi:hypothetical protein
MLHSVYAWMQWPFRHSDDIHFIVKTPYMCKNMHFQLLFTWIEKLQTWVFAWRVSRQHYLYCFTATTSPRHLKERWDEQYETMRNKVEASTTLNIQIHSAQICIPDWFW